MDENFNSVLQEMRKGYSGKGEGVLLNISYLCKSSAKEKFKVAFAYLAWAVDRFIYLKKTFFFFKFMTFKTLSVFLLLHADCV